MIDSEEARHILDAITNAAERGFSFRQRAMRILNELPHFDWSGVYRLEGDTLVLDAYCGAETDHVQIPVGTGVCGTAVAENRNQVIQDVRELDNYLACSLETRSEIVVLIRSQDVILGQIDIDGHRPAAFDSSEEQLLDSIAAVLADRWQ